MIAGSSAAVARPKVVRSRNMDGQMIPVPGASLPYGRFVSGAEKVAAAKAALEHEAPGAATPSGSDRSGSPLLEPAPASEGPEPEHPPTPDTEAESDNVRGGGTTGAEARPLPAPRVREAEGTFHGGVMNVWGRTKSSKEAATAVAREWALPDEWSTAHTTAKIRVRGAPTAQPASPRDELGPIQCQDKEDFVALESRQGLAAEWLGLVTLALRAELFAACPRRPPPLPEESLTARMRRKIAVWVRRARRALVVRARLPSISLPSAGLLHRREPFFADWAVGDVVHLLEASMAAAAQACGDEMFLETYAEKVHRIRTGVAAHRCNAPLAAALHHEAEVRHYEPGEYVFHAGDRDTTLCLVLSGMVELVLLRNKENSTTASVPADHQLRGPPLLGGKAKAKTKANGTTVKLLNDGHIFGEYELLTCAPRATSAVCSAPTDVLVLSRHEVYTYLSRYSPLVVRRLLQLAVADRQEQMRLACPMAPDDLRVSEVFADWPVDALHTVNAAFEPLPMYASGGERPFDQSGELATVYVVSGALQVEATIGEDALRPSTLCTLRAGDLYGAEATLLGSEYYSRDGVRDVRFVPIGPAEVWVLRREEFVGVAVRHAVHVVASRDVLNKRRAATLQRPVLDTVPALAEHPVLRYVLPPGVLRDAWAHAVCEVFTAGDAVCREGEVPEGAQLWLVTAGTVNVRTARPPRGPSAEYVSCEDEPSGGLVVGAEEFGMRLGHCLATVHCSTACVAWRIPVSLLETAMFEQHPLAWSSVCSDATAATVTEHYAANTLALLVDDVFRPGMVGVFTGPPVQGRGASAAAALRRL